MVFVLLEDDVDDDGDDDDVARIQMPARPTGTSTDSKQASMQFPREVTSVREAGVEFLPRSDVDHGRCSGAESEDGLCPRAKSGRRAAGLQTDRSAWRWLEQVSPG